MESQLPRSYVHHSEQESVEDEHHHDKKSMLGKVKEKAKKIKNSLKKHGHGHEQYEEIVRDPEIHGAPIYDSATVTSIQTPRTVEFDSGLHKDNLERPLVMKEDRYESMFEKPPERTFAEWEAEDEKSQEKPDDQHVAFSNLRENAGVPGENLGVLGVHMEEDSNAPGKDRIFGAPSNYETKVVDYTDRRKETGVTPILRSLDKMGIYDEHQSKPKLETNQNQGQSSPSMYDELHNILGTKQNLGKSSGSRNQFSPMLQDEPSNKQNIGANQNVGSTTTDSHKPNLQTNQYKVCSSNGQSPYSPDLGDRNIPDLGSPGIYDEPRTDHHVGTKQSLGEPTAGHDQFHPETRSTNDSTAKSPDESSYTSMILSATSSVADKATSAKDAVVSTLRYSGPVTGKSTSNSGQGGGLAEKVTETLAPVYEKVAEAGTAVMSKVSPSDTSGASSVKEYWIEKLKPGEEDKALSDVISDAVSANPATAAEEENIGKRGTREVVSDAVHKRAPDETKTRTTTSVSGRVTESKDGEELEKEWWM